jgi:arginyl-tRNA synthetase
MTPKQVADKICESIPSHQPLIASTSTAPNGFINIHLSSALMGEVIASVIRDGPEPPCMQKMKIVVDFSSPNIAKEMHVGHLRSTIIGDSVCRILEYCGHEVHRTNHVGDWGTQFGMLITYLLEAYPDILTNPPNISDLTAIYKASKKRFDEDEAFKETSRLNVVKLQGGDAECRKIWNLLCDISRLEFQKVYDLLDVRLEEVGESFYNPMIPGVIDVLEKRKLAYDEDGMLIIKLPHFTIPLIVRKSDGGYGYDSTDMAAVHHRLFEKKADWIIYITDAGQASHFYMVFDAAKACGWLKKDSPQRLDHIGFGVVCGEDGKRFKTRSSETVRLIDLLNEAKARMATSMGERVKEGKSDFTPQEIEDASGKIGYGAVKYFDLKQNPSTNYIFNYDRMLDTKGDTAVYLLFAYARVASILRKAQSDKGKNLEELYSRAIDLVQFKHPSERALAFEVMQFGDTIRRVLKDLLPNVLCQYLSNLCVVFTDFVTKCNVLNSEEVDSRLLLCETTRRVMFKCFELLGIEALDRI